MLRQLKQLSMPASSLMRICITLLLLFFTVNLQISWAAQPTPHETEELNRRARQEAEDRKQRETEKDIFLQEKIEETVDESLLPTEELAFEIHTIRIEGERIKAFPWIQSMLDRYAGQRIGQEGLNIIVRNVTKALVGRGYITTRVVVPEQDLSSGTLLLTLVPGTISDIRFERADYEGTWKTAFPVRPGDLLNLRDIEQGLEQMKRVPSQDVDIQLLPGKQPGESDILIIAKETNPYKVTLSMDDSGSKATGRLQTSATFSADNLLGLNDLFHISFNKDAERESNIHGTRGDSLYYSLPYGYWTYSLSKSSYDYHQTIPGLNTNYISSGISDNTEFKIQRLIHRDQTSKTSLGARIIKKHSKSFIDDTEIEVQCKETTAAELSLTHRRYIGKTVWDMELANRRGVSWFGAQSEPDNLPAESPTTRYQLWTFDTTLTRPVKLGKTPGTYTFNLRGQLTHDYLYGSDYFAIGNRYTVRGFDGEQTLSAERGWLIRNELGLAIGNNQELYTGIDYGRVSGPSTKWLLGTHLTGATIGLRGSINRLYYDVFVGCPINKPEGYKTASPTYGFQLIYQ